MRFHDARRNAIGAVLLFASLVPLTIGASQDKRKPVRAKVKVAVFTGGVDADLKALRAALAKITAVKLDVNELKFSDFKRDGGLFVAPTDFEFTDLAKTDVGAVAKAVVDIRLSKNDGGVYLFMRYRPESIDTKKLRAALAKMKGVNADKSWAGDANIWVHVDGAGHGKLAEITRALHGAGAKFRDPITDIDEP